MPPKELLTLLALSVYAVGVVVAANIEAYREERYQRAFPLDGVDFAWRSLGWPFRCIGFAFIAVWHVLTTPGRWFADRARGRELDQSRRDA